MRDALIESYCAFTHGPYLIVYTQIIFNEILC